MKRLAVVLWILQTHAWAHCSDRRLPAETFSPGPGITLNYEVHGSGPRTIVALHGLSASLDTWRDILPDLERLGTVYLVDLIGYGHSSKPHDFPYTATSEAEVVDSFLMRLESQGRSRIVLLAHSFGGAVALELAARHPVAQIVLIDPLVSFDSVRLHQMVSAVNLLPGNQLALSAIPARHRAWVGLHRAFRRDSQITEERVCRYAQFFDVPGANRAFIKTVKALHLNEAREYLDRIPCPVLVIWGDKDPILNPSEAGRLVKALPNARLVWMEHCGHVPQEEWPERTAQAIAGFLAR